MTHALIKADARRIPLADGSVHCVVTSPPYFALRDYGEARQIGLEATVAEYVAAMVSVFREVRRVLRDDGTVWINIGDTFASETKGSGGSGKSGLARDGRREDTRVRLADESNARGKFEPRRFDLGSDGFKAKDLMMIPARLAIALQADGWYLRSEVIWAKKNGMPESVRDRPLRAHEQVYLLSKNARYFYDTYAIRTPQKTFGRRHEGRSGYREGHPSKGGISVRALNPLGAATRSVWSLSNGGGFRGSAETCRLVVAESGALCDGTTRTASPGCPLHAGPTGPACNVPGGGHGADPTGRISRTDDRPSPGPPPGPDTTGRPDGHCSAVHSSDSTAPSCSRTATPRSSRTSRTAPDPGTIPSCKPSAQTPGGTGDTPVSRDSCGPPPSKPSSRTAEGGSACSGSRGIPGCTVHRSGEAGSSSASIESLRRQGCICTFYREETKKTSHFATMPLQLAARCIRLGTSERGCCPACGSPWTRVVEKVRRPTRPGSDSKVPGAGGSGVVGNRDPLRHVTEARLVGWESSCTCREPEPIPCTVLDPFNGAATSGVAALALGRSYVGTDISDDYLRQSRERIERPHKPARPAPAASVPMPLFSRRPAP